MRMSTSYLLLLKLVLAIAIARSSCVVALDVGYYAATCPDAEATVRQAMEQQFYNDNTIGPALIRMLFHDCFVRGCDASVMIVPTRAARSTERVAIPNQTLRGFNYVDRVKKVLEAACPGVVSCADALALMARDSVVLLGGAAYDVPLGRRDGLQSNSWEVNLPAPFAPLDDVLAAFAAKGFSAEETVVLLGGHTVGATHCAAFRYRLKNADDGKMDGDLGRAMTDACGVADMAPGDDPTEFMDPDTPFVVDNACFGQMVGNRSLLQVDQEAATHAATAGHVAYYAASPDAFVQRFSEAMAKLATVGVLEGDAGEVRKVCSAYNK